MRTLLALTILAFMTAACKKDHTASEDQSSGIVGSWKLIERLSDPGDGSGTFMPVNENKILVFDANGSFESNDNMCFSGSGGNPSSGTYDTTNLTLSPNGCTASGMDIRYALSNDTLIISYPCIEPCREKFIKQ